MSNIPLLEFDPTPEALIEPKRIFKPLPVPEACVLVFFQDVLNRLKRWGKTRVIAKQNSEIGTHPLYEIKHQRRRLAVFHPGVGAPLAAAFLDELIARGCRRFIVCGGCGVLNCDLAVGHLIVPVSAVRDEGTSFHYLPPSREVAADPRAVSVIEQTLKQNGVAYVTGKTWTTDAPYRETPEKIKRRRAEGCLTVEMEAAALFAVAQFRGVTLGQILCGGDDVSGLEWDHRGWQKQTAVREKLFWLAAEAALNL
ncbi:MAG: nucleoside phosphorylase [Anaerolineales bacterium]